MKPSLHDKQLNALLDSGNPSSEYRQIEERLDRRRLRLALPEPLESQYCRAHDAAAAASFALTVNWALAFYLLLGGLMLVLHPFAGHGVWWLSYAVFLLLVLIGRLVSRTVLVQRHYQPVVCAIGALATFYAVLQPCLMDDPDVRSLTHQGTVFVVVLVYLGLHLRFWYGVLAGTVAGSLAFPLIALLELHGEWQYSVVTFYGAGALAALLRFREEQRDRKVFLQARLLEVDNDRIQQLADELERLSFLDGLTGLANRRYFDRMFDKAWRNGMRDMHPVSLIMLDVDFFKRYNDHYGHQQGDHCLKEVARAISLVTARPLDLAARWGGEEFILLFPRTDNLAARHLADRLLQKVQELKMPHEVSECSDHVSVSAGIATAIPSPDMSREDLLAAADRALYHAKHQGRNRWVSVDDVL